MGRGHSYHLSMTAKCDLCGDQATVHEVSVHNGVGVERNLCERCAALAGLGLTMGMPPSGTQPQTPPGPKQGDSQTGGQSHPPQEGQADIHDLIKHFLSQTIEDPAANISVTHNLTISNAGGATNITFGNAPTPVPGRSAHCGGCGLSYADFKQSGLLGCPNCYVYFEHLIGPLIERAQEGGVCHTGKSPMNTAAPKPDAGAPEHNLGTEHPRVQSDDAPSRAQASPDDAQASNNLTSSIEPTHKQANVNPPDEKQEDIVRSQEVRELCSRLVAALRHEDYRTAAQFRDKLKAIVPADQIETVLAHPATYARRDSAAAEPDSKGGGSGGKG